VQQADDEVVLLPLVSDLPGRAVQGSAYEVLVQQQAAVAEVPAEAGGQRGLARAG
jgi:hypothetical protein